MDAENKDYAFKNEISLSIGDESLNSSSSTSTPSTVSPLSGPTPSPRQNPVVDDKKPLTKKAGDMKKPEGIDNKAFEAEKTPGKPLTSFGNGHSNSLNDSGANGANKNGGQLNEKKLAEAVNLELININSNNNAKKPTTTNGKHNNNDLPAKKDSDVEMGTTKDESYDEYFVPVNKHRKYMGLSKSRKLHGVAHNGLSLESPEYGIVNYNEWIDSVSRGEKLYVTQDKRTKTQKNKLCWILCIGLVAAVIILGILTASGAFNKSESPIEARNLKSTANDSVAVAGFGGGSNDRKPDSSTTSSTTTEMPLPPPILDTTASMPAGDKISYVPNTLEGQITLSNAEYSNEYNDPNSPIYKKLIKDLEYEIKNALSQNGNEEFFIKIIGLKSGSVVVDYRVSWDKSNSEMSSDEMMERIQNFLNKNNQQFMSRYRVNLNTIRTARVPDRCASDDKNSCDYGCEFSAKKVDFECTCPVNMVYDDDFKECVNDDDSIFVDHSSSAEPEPSGEPQSNDNVHQVHHSHEHHEHHYYESSSTSEPSSEPKSEPESTSEPTSEPEPSSEPKSEPEPTSEPKSEPESASEPKSEPEPSSEPKSEPESTSEPRSEPEPTSEPKSEPETTSEPKSEPEPSSEPKSEPEPSSEPKSEPEPTSEPKSEPESTSEPKSEPETTSEPKSEPEPTSEPKSEPEPSSEPKSELEPTSEPKAEPEPTSEPASDHQHDTIVKPALESSSNKTEDETIYKGDKKSKILDEADEEKTQSRSKPVSEDFEDIPRPTENYFSISRSKDLKSEVNVFDMNSTTQSSSNTTIYSTATPIHLWLSENTTNIDHLSDSHDMSPFLPAAENTNQKTEEKIYSVTENVAEGEAPHNQSPFLPELENNETLHHILHGGHGMISDESEEANKTFSITVTYTNETHTDSPIIKVVPIQNDSSTKSLNLDSTTIASEIQITSEISNGDSSSTTNVPSTTQESTEGQSSTSTTEKSDEDEDEEKEEEETLNLFGEDVESEEKDEEAHSSTSVAPENSTASESTTPESNIQVLLTTHPAQHSSESTTQYKIEGGFVITTTPEPLISNEASSTSVPSNTSEQSSSTSSSANPSSTSQLPLTSSESSTTEAIFSTTETILSESNKKLEQSANDSTTVVPVASSTEAETQSPYTFAFETSTTVNFKVLDSGEEDSKSKITLDSFNRRFEESDDNSLKVIPLGQKELPTTTTEANLLTSENEITEKTETTGHFLEQTTFPSIKSESDEASNFRNGKILPDSVSKDDADKKSQQSLETDNLDKNKLFKQEFIDKLNITFDRTSCSDDQFKCVLTNECIAKSKICDGKAQCSDNSDEWNCFNVSIDTKILQVKQEEKLFKVCATKWTNELSNKVCNKLGYSGADAWKNNRDVMTKDEKYLTVKDGALEAFEFADSCSDGLVEIECASYACGANSTKGDSGEFSSISLVVNRDSTMRCTASIISPLWALTSASCVNKPDQEWILIAGSTELNMSKISKSSVISLIGNVVTYPESDFALLELKQVLSFADQIYSTCLSEKQSEPTKECLTTGWLVKGSNNSYEKYEKIAAVDRNCTSQLNSLCASTQNRLSNECYNDKGAALYCYSESNSRWLLNGIQNQHNDCQDVAKPSIFTSLSSKTIDWIKNTVGNSRMFIQ